LKKAAVLENNSTVSLGQIVLARREPAAKQAVEEIAR
jgi:hypothetical protein